MPVVVRKVRQSAWDGAKAVTDEWLANPAHGFLLRPGEDRLSVFLAGDAKDRALVAAAIVASKCEEGHVDLLPIDEERLGDIKLVVDEGDTPVPAANSMHRSLAADPEVLRALAVRLRELGSKAIRVKWQEVRAALLDRIDPPELVGARAEEARRFIAQVRTRADRRGTGK